MSDPRRADAGRPSPSPTALLLDLVQWIAERPRPYDQVMDAWRTSCPRLTVWEDAVDAGYVRRRRAAGGEIQVLVTDRGLRFLADHDRAPVQPESPGQRPGPVARRG